MSQGVAPPVVGLEEGAWLMGDWKGESTLEDIGTMSGCEWVCTLWAGGIVNIPAIARIKI